jgi:hypothetical protein
MAAGLPATQPLGEAAMTAPLIAPSFPRVARPGGREHGPPGPAWRAPPVRWPARRPSRDVVYGFGRIDASGRVADRAMTIARWAGAAVTG